MSIIVPKVIAMTLNDEPIDKVIFFIKAMSTIFVTYHDNDDDDNASQH